METALRCASLSMGRSLLSNREKRNRCVISLVRKTAQGAARCADFGQAFLDVGDDVVPDKPLYCSVRVWPDRAERPVEPREVRAGLHVRLLPPSCV